MILQSQQPIPAVDPGTNTTFPPSFKSIDSPETTTSLLIPAWPSDSSIFLSDFNRGGAKWEITG
jgi:hypothetical protein